MRLSQHLQLWVQGLQHRSPELRRDAAYQLRGQRHPRIITALCDAFARESEPETRAELARSLGETDSGLAVHALCERFPTEADPAVREAIVLGLGRLRDPDAVPTVRTALSDPQLAIRLAAAEALAACGETCSQEHALQALYYAALQPRAVEWLAAHGDAEGIDAMLDTLAESLGWSRMGECANPPVPRSAFDALPAHLRRAVESLQPGLPISTVTLATHRAADWDARLGIWICVALRAEARDRIRKLLVEALEDVSSRVAMLTLCRVLREDVYAPVREAAAGVLSAYTEPEATQALGDALRDRRLEIRFAAAEALAHEERQDLQSHAIAALKVDRLRLRAAGWLLTSGDKVGAAALCCTVAQYGQQQRDLAELFAQEFADFRQRLPEVDCSAVYPVLHYWALQPASEDNPFSAAIRVLSGHAGRNLPIPAKSGGSQAADLPIPTGLSTGDPSASAFRIPALLPSLEWTPPRRGLGTWLKRIPFRALVVTSWLIAVWMRAWSNNAPLPVEVAGPLMTIGVVILTPPLLIEIGTWLRFALERPTVRLSGRCLEICYRVFSVRPTRRHQLPTYARVFSIIRWPGHQAFPHVAIMDHRGQPVRFGFGLNETEQQQLVEQINAHLAQLEASDPAAEIEAGQPTTARPRYDDRRPETFETTSLPLRTSE